MGKSSTRSGGSNKSSSSHSATPTRDSNTQTAPYKDLSKFARDKGFTVTSTTGGQHNKGSAHYQGRAIDVSVKGKSNGDINKFKKAAEERGYKVRDERTKPPGQKVWSAPHL